MVVIDGRTRLAHVPPDTCWELLAAARVGRIGVLVDSAPEVYPVNFVVDGRSIVFRTDPGSKLRGLERSPSVCFEVDGFDFEERTGWSVLVKGRAVEVTDPDELRRVSALPLNLWSFGDKSHWMRVQAAEVTGRRIDRPRDEQSPGGAPTARPLRKL